MPPVSPRAPEVEVDPVSSHHPPSESLPVLRSPRGDLWEVLRGE